MKAVVFILTVVFFSPFLKASEQCQGYISNLPSFTPAACSNPEGVPLFTCKGRGLFIAWNNKPFMENLDFEIKVCHVPDKGLEMEIFPYALLQNHYTQEDLSKTLVTCGVQEGNTSISGIFNGNTWFTIVANDMTHSEFKAQFYDGSRWDYDLKGEVNCVKK